MSYTFRSYVETDIPFIQSSWGSSYYKGAFYKRYLSPQDFHKHHRPIRERFFERDGTAVIVCCATDNPDLIIGWIAVEKPKESRGLILHYVYVKQAFKGEKISNELIKRALPDKPVMVTHMTERALNIMERKKIEYFYAPHLI